MSQHPDRVYAEYIKNTGFTKHYGETPLMNNWGEPLVLSYHFDYSTHEYLYSIYYAEYVKTDDCIDLLQHPDRDICVYRDFELTWMDTKISLLETSGDVMHIEHCSFYDFAIAIDRFYAFEAKFFPKSRLHGKDYESWLSIPSKIFDPFKNYEPLPF